MTMRKTVPERKRSSSEQFVCNNGKKTKLALIFSMVAIVAIASFSIGLSISDEDTDVSAAVVTPGANQFATDGLVYTITGTNDVTIAGWATGSDLGDLVIPETVENNTITYTVTGVANNALESNATLTSVEIPATIGTIGSRAFNDCANLTSIDVDENNVSFKSIGGVLFNKAGTTLIQFPAGKTVTGQYEIPDGVVTIGTYSFSSGKVEQVLIPSTVKTIENSAFTQSALKTLNFDIECSGITIGGSAFYNTKLTSVDLSAVISINNSAFSNCKDLTYVDISNLTNMTSYVFRGSGLTSIDIPGSLNSIGTEAFMDCKSLKTVTFAGAATISTDAFRGCTVLDSLTFGDSPVIIDNTAFFGTTALLSVDIPSGSSLGANSFRESGLKSVSLPTDVTMSGNVFQSCSINTLTITEGASLEKPGSNLSSVIGAWTIADSSFSKLVIDVGGLAYVIDSDLTETVGKSIEFLSGSVNTTGGTFYVTNLDVTPLFREELAGKTFKAIDGKWSELQAYAVFIDGINIEINESWPFLVLEGGDFALTFTALEHYELPSTIIVTIDTATLATGSYTYDPSTGVMTIPEEEITGDIAITVNATPISYTIVLESNSETMGTMSVKGETGLTFPYGTVITLKAEPNSSNIIFGWFDSDGELICIGSEAEITVTGNDTYKAGFISIEPTYGDFKYEVNGAGEGMYLSLTDYLKSDEAFIPAEVNVVYGVFLPVTEIKEGAFDGDSAKVNVPASVTSIEARAFNSQALEEMVVDENNKFYSSVDGVLFSADGKNLIAYPAGKVTTIYEVPGGVEIIEIYAFYYAYVGRVILPDGLKIIGGGAFMYSSVTSINIPVSVTILGDNIFNMCEDLKHVDILAEITGISAAMFYNCSSLTQITLPNSVEYIGEEAFANSGLLTMVLPLSISEIDEDAFRNCDSLVSISMPTNTLSFGDGVFYDCTALDTVIITKGTNTVSMIINQHSFGIWTLPGGTTYSKIFIDVGDLALVLPTNINGDSGKVIEFSQSSVNVTGGAFYETDMGAESEEPSELWELNNLCGQQFMHLISDNMNDVWYVSGAFASVIMNVDDNIDRIDNTGIYLKINEPATIVIQAKANYALPLTIVVTVNNAPLTQGIGSDDYQYDPVTGVIIIPASKIILYAEIEITAAAVPREYIVTLPSSPTEYALKGDDGNAPGTTVAYGEAYSVTVDLKPKYSNSTISLSFPSYSGAKVTGKITNDNGSITFVVEGFTDDFGFNVEGIKVNTYTVTLQGNNISLAEEYVHEYGSITTVFLVADEHYSLPSTIYSECGGVPILTPPLPYFPETGKVECIGNGNIVIFADGVPDEYTVTLPTTMTGYALKGMDGNALGTVATFGTEYVVNVLLTAGYTQSDNITLTVIPSEGVIVIKDPLVNEFKVTGFTGNFTLAVSNVEPNSYQIEITGTNVVEDTQYGVYLQGKEVIIKAKEHYVLPESIDVEVGVGYNPDSGWAYYPKTGRLVIDSGLMYDDILITVNCSPEEYTVTLPTPVGYTLADGNGDALGDKVLYGSEYVVKVTLSNGYEESNQIGLTFDPSAGMTVAPGERVGNTFTFTVTGFTSSCTMEVSGVVLNVYAMTVDGTKVSNTGQDDTTHGTDAIVSFAANEHYVLPLLVDVTIGNTPISAEEYTYDRTAGTVSIPGTLVTGDIQVTVNCSPEEYTISLPTPNGYTLTGEDGNALGDKAFFDSEYVVKVTLNEGYTRSNQVGLTYNSSDDISVVPGERVDDTFKFTLTGFTENFSFKIEGVVLNEYTVTLIGENIALDKEYTVKHGESENVYLISDSPYVLPDSVQVTYGGEPADHDGLYSKVNRRVLLYIVTGDVVITADGVPEKYVISLPTPKGYTITDENGNALQNTVAFGGEYVVKVTLNEGYTMSNQVSLTFDPSAGITSVPEERVNNTFTFTVTGFTDGFTLGVSGVVPNVYAMTIGGTGSSKVGQDDATYGEDATVKFSANEHYALPISVDVTIGGAPIDEGQYTYDRTTGTVFIYGTFVTEKIHVNVDCDPDEYTVTLPTPKGYTLTDKNGNALQNEVLYGSEYVVTVTLGSNHKFVSPILKLTGSSGAEISATDTSVVGKVTFTVDGFTENFGFTIEGVVPEEYSVEQPDEELGYTVSAPTMAVFGKEYEIRITLSYGYAGTDLDVDVNGAGVVEKVTVSETSYIFKVTGFTGPFGFTVSGAEKVIGDMTETQGIGYVSYAPLEAVDGYDIVVSLTLNYNGTAMSIITGDGEVTGPTQIGDRDYVFTVAGFTGIPSFRVVGVVPDEYDVTFQSGDGYTISAPETVKYGEEYEVKVTLDIGYDRSEPTISAAGLLKSDGIKNGNVWTFVIKGFISDFEFSVSGVVLNTYAVTGPSNGTGYTVSADNNVTHGQSYTITVTLLTGYTDSVPFVALTQGTGSVSAGVKSENAYTFTVTGSTGPSAFTISGVALNEYDVEFSKSGTGYTVSADEKATHGGNYVITVTLERGYVQSTPSLILPSGLEAMTKNGNEYTFTVANVTGGFDFSVSGVTADEYVVDVPDDDVGYTITASDSAAFGTVYTIKVTLLTGYTDSVPLLTPIGIGNGTLTAKGGNGVDGYMYEITGFDKDFGFSVSRVLPNKYDIEFSESGTGYTVTADKKATYGESYVITVTLERGYVQSTPSVVLPSGTEVMTKNGIVCTFTVTNVTGSFGFSVEDVVPDEYAVDVPDDSSEFSVIAATTAVFGTEYAVAVTVSQGYDAPKVVLTGSSGIVGNAEKDGNKYTFKVTGFADDFGFAVTFTVDDYVVTFSDSGNGYTVSADPTATYGEGYEITVKILPGYTGSTPSITLSPMNAAFVGTPDKDDNEYTFILTGFSGNFGFTVSDVVLNEYTVTKPTDGTGYSISASPTATHGSAYTITMTIEAGYSNSSPSLVLVNKNTAVLGESERSGNDITFRVTGFTDDFGFTVSGVVLNQYTVTVNADGRGSATGSGTYGYGHELTMSAVADNGYRFVRWADGNLNVTRTVTVISNVSYTAVFELIPTSNVSINDILTDGAIDETKLVNAIAASEDGITITIPVGTPGLSELTIPEGAFDDMNGKVVRIRVTDGDMVYEWIIDGNSAYDADAEISFRVAVTMHLNGNGAPEGMKEKVNAYIDANDLKDEAIYLSFSASGTLPYDTTVTYKVGTAYAGKTFKLFFFNEGTNTLASEGTKTYTVSADGYITVDLTHCSSFALITTATAEPGPGPGPEPGPSGDGDGGSGMMIVAVIAVVAVVALLGVYFGVIRKK